MEPSHLSAKILIVDDEAPNVRLLERMLRHAGYANIRSLQDPRRTLALYDEFQPDLVLLDLHMPHVDGFALLAELGARLPPGGYVPVLVLTADATAAALRRALEAGASDFLTKPFDQQEALLRIGNLLHTRLLHVTLEDQNRMLEARVQERTQRLLQAEKLSAMGQLLAGVAHELNNPLSVVMGQALLLEENGEDVPVRAAKITKAAERCVRIVRNFLALARERPPERARTRLNRVLAEALELLGYELRTGGIEVRQELAPDLPVLWADPHQLHQVVVNLLVNAQHAMAGIKSPRVLTLSTSASPDRQRVALMIEDTGPGMSAEIRARIFEPFFTTKPVGQGTGLGLSLSAGIVESHGGTIAVESDAGKGARFRIELPVVAPPTDRLDGRSAEPSVEHAGAQGDAGGTDTPAGRSRPRILVVDDEPDVAELVADLLRRDGYDVDVVHDGVEGLEQLDRVRYDAIICDTKMPVLDGPGFYQALVGRHPELVRRIAFVTGDVLNADKRAFLESVGVPNIAKPFDLEDVRRVVRQLVGEVTPR